MKNNIQKHNETAITQALKSKSNKRDGSYASIQERFKLLIKEYYSLQEEPYEYSLNCDSEIKEVKEIFQKFKALQKEIENKTYGCGKDIGGAECGIFIEEFEGEDGIEYGRNYYCEEHKAEKEADEKILKQIKEILK